MRFFGIIFLVFFMGCGYYPIAHYSKKALGNSVYVALKVNLANTESSVEIKDILNKIVATRFQKNLTSKDMADTILQLELENINDTSIATNIDGFTTFYRVDVGVNFYYKNRFGEEKKFRNMAYYDYAVSLEDPLVTYSNRLEAIREASLQCIDRFLTQIAYEGK